MKLGLFRPLDEMKALLSSSSFSFSSSQCHHRCFCFSSIFNTIYKSHFFLLHLSSSSVPSSPINNPNPIFIDYLINTFGFSKPQLDYVSKRFGSRKAPQKPDSVVNLFREFGFSETQIRNSVLLKPQILSSDVGKTLKPKLSLFQKELGLTGSHLGVLISKNPNLLYNSLERRLIPNISLLQKEFGITGAHLGHFISSNTNLLTISLERTLIPNISLLKKILLEVETEIWDRHDLTLVVQRFSLILTRDDKMSKLLPNISFLKSCGIVGSQLFSLFEREPLLFIKSESALRDLVRQAQDMGFSCHSRMLVRALRTLHKMSSKTLDRKFKLLRSFGFSQEECLEMFRSTPGLLTVSEKKLKLGIDFFDSAGFERKMLVHNPMCLMVSLEKRVITRFRVYQILKSKQQELLKNKCPSFPSILSLNEKRFLEKYVFKFRDNAEELLAAYNNGNVLNSLMERN